MTSLQSWAEHRGRIEEDHLFKTRVLPALTYASETWAMRKQDENAVGVIERSIERVMLGITRLTQVRAGMRSSTLHQQSKIKDAAAYATLNKIRWAGPVMRFNENRCTKAVSDWNLRNVKRTTGRLPIRWSDFFTKSFKDRCDALRVSRTDRIHGQLWLARGTNGRIAGARSVYPKINGSQGDQGDQLDALNTMV